MASKVRLHLMLNGAVYKGGHVHRYLASYARKFELALPEEIAKQPKWRRCLWMFEHIPITNKSLKIFRESHRTDSKHSRYVRGLETLGIAMKIRRKPVHPVQVQSPRKISRRQQQRLAEDLELPPGWERGVGRGVAGTPRRPGATTMQAAQPPTTVREIPDWSFRDGTTDTTPSPTPIADQLRGWVTIPTDPYAMPVDPTPPTTWAMDPPNPYRIVLGAAGNIAARDIAQNTAQGIDAFLEEEPTDL